MIYSLKKVCFERESRNAYVFWYTELNSSNVDITTTIFKVILQSTESRSAPNDDNVPVFFSDVNNTVSLCIKMFL